jgi:hypothetical protein
MDARQAATDRLNADTPETVTDTLRTARVWQDNNPAA